MRAGTSQGWWAALVVTAMMGCAELADVARQLPQFPQMASGPLDERTVASGLREALTVGTGRAAGRLSRAGGYSKHPVLRLALPDEFDSAARVLRGVGLGHEVDALESSMNRAAEAAAAEAVPVFAEAVRSMTVPDALAILRGGDTAATDFFRARTSAGLRRRFVPIVRSGMSEAGLYRVYDDLQARVRRLPIVSLPTPDLEGHVTDGALRGLFGELAREEARIRSDPAARTSALLRQVFGSGEY